MSRTTRLEQSVEFAENPEPRCPCLLLLDTSGSMLGEPIDALNRGLKTFKDDLALDATASRRVEVGVIAFDSDIEVIQDFITVDQFHPPILKAKKKTFMGTAIQKALDMVDARKAQYRANGITYYRPWIFMITDGEPQGEPAQVVETASQRIKFEETNNRVAFFAVGVQTANMTRLKEIAVRDPVKLKGLNFQDLFMWLSASMQKISLSKSDEQVELPPAGWATV